MRSQNPKDRHFHPLEAKFRFYMYQKLQVDEARASDIRPEVRYHKALQSIHVNAETDLRRVKVRYSSP